MNKPSAIRWRDRGTPKFPHVIVLVALLALSPTEAEPVFRAGAAAVDITPPQYPVRVNGGFLEATATSTTDPIHARALALDDGVSKLVFCIVDTCMMPRDLIDGAKAQVSAATGLPTDRMMVSATHTHTAPAAMGCLGARMDPDYAAWLPGKLVEAMTAALSKLQHAQIGWSSIDDWEHTHNRRWIRRADKMFADPFGDMTVRAHMHPGYESSDVIGPSGPVDPELSVLAVKTPEGKPIALLANYSQHYFGSTPVSADYYGHFCRQMAAHLGQSSSEGEFVAMISQGTSGDLMWMDYGSPQNKPPIEDYAAEVAGYAIKAWHQIEWRDQAPLAVSEKKLELNFRVPDEKRLAWAREQVQTMSERLPENQPEVYAHEAIYLHERPTAELVLQAIQIGDLGITTLPNEVYAITGLKLKAQSPLKAHFNIELANGAEGYIPPPEQHALGGYTTWPARTAGLEVEAEPKIVETLIGAMEEATGKPRKAIAHGDGPYAEAVMKGGPSSYWRMNDIQGTSAVNAVPGGSEASLVGGYALYLPGPGSGSGIGATEALKDSAFSGAGHINRAVHFVGGRMTASVAGFGGDCTVTLWFWLGEVSGASDRGGTLVTLPSGDTLNYRTDARHQATLSFVAESGEVAGTASVAANHWHFVALVREGGRVRLHLDGGDQPYLSGAATGNAGEQIQFGAGLEGKLDEVAVFPRALPASEIASLWGISGAAKYNAGEAGQLYSAAGVGLAAPQAGLDSLPLSPEKGLKSIQVPEGFTVDLVAAEPLLLDPVAFDWDGHGRLWVVEMADYPLGMDGNGAPGGRIRMLEDRDRDGTYDQSKLFAEGLSFPTGIITWRDGVIVTAAPDVIFLRDTNGDNVADEREVLLTGLTTGNQQLRANGLRWGLDNWVYVAAGGHHGEYGLATKIKSSRNGTEVPVGSRDFRFRPDTGEVEPQSGPTQFGRNRDDWGHWFGTQNSRPLWHYVLQDQYLKRNPHLATPDGRVQVLGAINPPVFPASTLEKRFHNFQESGRYTSACSGMIYRDGTLFPQEEMNGFACEPFHNLVQRMVLVPEGASFAARRGGREGEPDFFASDDRWCRPVMVRTGPDGALWIADMYRYMIEHPDWLPEEGKAELLPFYREGDDKGRVYRVRRTESWPEAVPMLAELDGDGLVAQLASSNGWVRDKAQQLLLWRGDKAAVPALEELTQSEAPRARLHALCTLDGLGALGEGLVAQALGDAHPGVRENALRLAESRMTPALVQQVASLAKDPDAHVRLQAAYSLGEAPLSQIAGDALAEILLNDHADPFITVAALSSALPHQELLIAELAKINDPAVYKFRPALANIALGAGNLSAVAELLTSAFSRAALSAAPLDLNSCVELLDVLARIEMPLEELFAVDNSLLGAFENVMDRANQTLGSDAAFWDSQVASAALLTRAPISRDVGLTFLALAIQSKTEAEVFPALAALADTGDDTVPRFILAAWPGFNRETKARAVDRLLSRAPWAMALLGAVGDERIAAEDIDPIRRSQLLRHPDGAVREAAVARLGAGSSPDRAKVIEAYQPALAMNADPAKGHALYKESCSPCHRIGEEGIDMGPDLRTVSQHPPEKILANILDPNLDIQPGYHAYNCELNDGEQLFGIIASENATSITLKIAGGLSRVILRSDIYNLESTSMSFMPDGWEATLKEQDVADLVAFLKSTY